MSNLESIIIIIIILVQKFPNGKGGPIKPGMAPLGNIMHEEKGKFTISKEDKRLTKQ